MQHVIAETMAVNAGSRRVMEKCGLILVRTYPAEEPLVDGAEQGNVEYALDKADWDRITAPA